MQFCQRRKYGVPADGFNLPASNVEYGFRQGTLPPVRKSWRPVPWASGVWLDVNDVSCAVLPPYFVCDGDVKDKILTLLKDFMVGGHGIQAEIFQMLYFCFASLCYHFDFLVKHLPKRNKLQASPFLLTSPCMQERQQQFGCHGIRQQTHLCLLECCHM